MKQLFLFILVLCLLWPVGVKADTLGWTQDGTIWFTSEGDIFGTQCTASSSGTLDTVWVYLKITVASKNVHCAVYKVGASDTALVDSSNERSIGVSTSWQGFELILDGSIFEDSVYAVVVNVDIADGIGEIMFKIGGSSAYAWAYEEGFGYGAWPALWHNMTNYVGRPVSIYALYTPEAEEEEAPVRYIQGPGGSRVVQSASGASEVQGP